MIFHGNWPCFTYIFVWEGAWKYASTLRDWTLLLQVFKIRMDGGFPSGANCDFASWAEVGGAGWLSVWPALLQPLPVWAFTLVLIYNEYRLSCNINKPRSLRPWVYLRIQIMRTMEVSGTVWVFGHSCARFWFLQMQKQMSRVWFMQQLCLVLATTSGWSHMKSYLSERHSELVWCRRTTIKKWAHITMKAWL